jgi:16S rRNA (adenine1518-N6/adenine1519-N6)-dimethyltransferase
LIKAKKSLGQNFLIDRNILKIISEVTSIKDKIVLEIGPGTGNLTSFILKKKPKKFIVIEKDNDLASNIAEIFKDQLNIINDDVLNVDENSLASEKITVFGNLPYNISTEILSRWIINLKNDFWFDRLVLMFQKEVADRIIANFNSSYYGRLTILSNWKLNIEKICDIKPESFSPRPKIESSLLVFSPKENFFKINDPKNLEKITRVFFNHRRKMIKKPYNQLFNGNQKVLDKLKIDLSLRPQNLNFETYYKLTNEFENLRD